MTTFAEHRAAVDSGVQGTTWGRHSGGTASALLAAIPSDQPFDARALLAAHPELLSVRSAVLDVVYEEYCRRTEAGEKVDPEIFAEQFPDCRTSLLRLLDVHDHLGGNLELLQAPVQWPDAGEEFLGFQLAERLGQGAFSRVFLAHESALGGRLVVVKVSRHGGVEPHALGMLKHRHIVPVNSVQQDLALGLTAICMPYLGRLTLHDLLDKAFAKHVPGKSAPRSAALFHSLFDGEETHAKGDGAEPSAVARLEGMSYVDAVLHLGVQMAQALAHAHQQRVFHCDIKPSNVLLTRDRGAMLLDFNLAWIHDRAAAPGGTLPYMAPEQLQLVARAGPKVAVNGAHVQVVLDGKNDVFSLAVVLYELLCGKLPWGRMPGDIPRQRMADELWRRQQQRPASLRRANPLVDARAASLIESCLAADPKKRPTAAELESQLQALLQGMPRLLRIMRSRRKAILAAAGLLACGSFLMAYPIATMEPAQARRLRLAKEAYLRREYGTTVSLLEQFLEEEPNHFEARFLHARLFLLGGDRYEAKKAFADMMERYPRNPYVAACLGWCLASNPDAIIPDFENAEGLFLRAHAALPSNSSLCHNIGYCSFRKRNYFNARDWLKRAIDLDGKSAVTHYVLAIVYAASGFQAPLETKDWLLDAVAQLELASNLDPRVGKIHIEAIRLHSLMLRQNLLTEQEREPAMQTALWHCGQAWRLGHSPKEIASAAASSSALAEALKAVNLTAQPRELSDPVLMPSVLDPLENTALADFASIR